MVAAIGSPPKEGAPAFQPLLANDLKNVGDAFQREKRLLLCRSGAAFAQGDTPQSLR